MAGSAWNIIGQGLMGLQTRADEQRRLNEELKDNELRRLAMQQGLDLGEINIQQAQTALKREDDADAALERFLTEQSLADTAKTARENVPSKTPEFMDLGSRDWVNEPVKKTDEQPANVPYSPLSPEFMEKDWKQRAVDTGLLRYGSDPDVASAIKTISDQPAGGQGFGGWAARSKDWENINAMPEGPEKEAAVTSYLYKWAPSTGYSASPSSVEQSTRRAVAVAGATSPISTQTAANTEAAKGDVAAGTPDFIAQRQKEWASETKPYKEVLQNYSFAKSGASGAISDVALVKALEKVREPNSAVMFGDAEIWRKAGNFWDKAVEGGIADAIKSGAQKRLPDVYRAEMTKLLDNAMKVARQNMEQRREAAATIAKNDYGWDDGRINRVYTMPKLNADSNKNAQGNKTSSGNRFSWQ